MFRNTKEPSSGGEHLSLAKVTCGSMVLVHVNLVGIVVAYTGLFISPSGISELDCATTKTDTAERSISISRESLQFFFFVLGTLAYFQVPPLGVVVTKNGVHSD